MPDSRYAYIIGYHSCDRELGLRLVNGDDELKVSKNTWDWLGEGIYFWEEDPARALQYAEEVAAGKQKNKVAAKVPFVIGAIIEPGKCLNLVEIESLQILAEAYEGLREVLQFSGRPMPVNNDNNRALDCAVINYINRAAADKGSTPYDSIRCAFPEGDEAFPGSKISSRLHIQLCVRNPDNIKGYFLPRPLQKYNPNLVQ